MGLIASLISPMELCQEWLYVINHGQNLNLANTWWDRYLAEFYQNVYVCEWERGYCQYQEGCACCFRKMPCPPHLSFGKEQKSSRDLYDEISWERWHSKGTFTGAMGASNFTIPHTCTPHPLPQLLSSSACCLGSIAGEQIVFSFLLRSLYANYSQIPHLQEASSVLPVGFVLGQITVLTGTRK